MRRQSAIFWLAIVMVAVLMVCLVRYRPTATIAVPPDTQANKQKTTGNASAGETPRPGATNAVKVFTVRPGQMLASVNGVPITLQDLAPLRQTNSDAAQQIDETAYNYLLQRAINRELIMQAAQARGVTLTEAEQQQLNKLQAMREGGEPGLVSKMTVNPTEISFDRRDEQAFMLQTALMSAMGSTPNVTPDQVEKYYQAHISEYGQLPADPQASQQAWQEINTQIRNQLAAGVRTQYQQQLDAYMQQLKAGANIVIAVSSGS